MKTGIVGGKKSFKKLLQKRRMPFTVKEKIVGDKVIERKVIVHAVEELK